LFRNRFHIFFQTLRPKAKLVFNYVDQKTKKKYKYNPHSP